MAQRLKVVVLGAQGRPHPDISLVEEQADVTYVEASELTEAIQDADVLFMWAYNSAAFKAAWPAAKNLKWVHTASAGVDQILFPEIQSSGVVITNSRDVFNDALAEYTLALMLSWVKDLKTTQMNQTQRLWQHRETAVLHGKTALVVGAGPIGRRIGELLNAFKVTVNAIARSPRPGDDVFATIEGPESLHARLGEADFVILIMPMTPATRGMFDYAALQSMKSDAFLINVARGGVVVESDLVRALESGAIAGAALDVFEQEPLPQESPLWATPNTVISPHMSADFQGRLNVLSKVFESNFHKWTQNRPLAGVVDKATGYVPTEQ